MADPTVITINRNSNFHSIQVDASASAGMVTNSVDIKIGGDLTIKGANSLSMTIAGVKVDAKLMGISVEGEFGTKAKLLNGANLRLSTADGEAFLAEAKLHMTKLKNATAVAEQAAVETRSQLTKAVKSATIIDANAFAAVI